MEIFCTNYSPESQCSLSPQCINHHSGAVTFTHRHDPFSNRQSALAVGSERERELRKLRDTKRLNREKKENNQGGQQVQKEKEKKHLAALPKWLPSGPSREAIYVNRVKEAARLASRRAGKHSQRGTDRQIEVWVLCVPVSSFYMTQQPQFCVICKQSARQVWLTEMEFELNCLSDSRDMRCKPPCKNERK